MVNPVLITLLGLIGLYITFDGIGSILYYWGQPTIPDQAIRVIRILSGLTIIIIDVLIGR